MQATMKTIEGGRSAANVEAASQRVAQESGLFNLAAKCIAASGVRQSVVRPSGLGNAMNTVIERHGV
jgi:hypothetical protein